MRIRFLSNTNIRRSPRDFSLPPLGIIFAGTEIEVDDRLYKGKDLDSINTYFRDERDWYYWSGRAAIIYKAIPAPRSTTPSTFEEQERIGGDWQIPLGDMEQTDKGTIELFTEKTAGQQVSPPAPPPPEIASRQGASGLLQPENSPVKASPPSVAPDKGFFYSANLLNWGLKKYRIQDWWNKHNLKGNGIRVAVLDTGIVSGHPDLKGNIRQVHNFCPGDTQDIEDRDGQGTQCAGLISGQGREDFLGIAPGAGLWIAKVMEHRLDFQIDRIWQALDWIFTFPIDLVLFGFDIRGDAITREQRFRLQTYMEQAVAKGMVLLAPMGESSGTRTEDRFPASFSQVLGVGAHGPLGERLSNGVRSYNLDLLAPGLNLFQDEPSRPASGASAFGAAFCTGFLALAMEFARVHHLRYSARDWSHFIKDTAQAKYQLTKCKDVEYGCGLLNPEALLEKLRAEVGEYAPDPEN